MNKRIKTILQFVIFLLLGIGIVWWIFHRMNDEQLAQCKNALLNANPYLIAVAFGCGLLAHFFRALRWKLLMEPLGYHPKTANTYAALLIGYLANLAFPKLGEVTRCGVLTKYEEIPFEKNFGTVIAERIFDTFCWLVLLLLSILIEFDRLYSFFKTEILNAMIAKWQNSSNMKWLLVAIFIIACVAGFIFIKKVLSRNQKIKSFIEGLTSGLKAILNLKKKTAFILYTILIWGSYVFTQYIGLLCVHETAHLSFWAALTCVSFATFGFVLPTQGGLGAYHAIISQVLKLYSIPEGIGLASAWVNWGIQQIAVVIGGFLSFIFLPIFNKKVNGE